MYGIFFHVIGSRSHFPLNLATWACFKKDLRLVKMGQGDHDDVPT